MRILIAGQTYYPGNNGQAIFTIHLAEGLARAGHDVAMIIPSTDLKYHRETINNVQVHKLEALGLGWIHPEVGVTPLPIPRIQSLIKTFRPHVVHIQDHYFLCRDVARVALRYRIPVMGTNHFLPENLLPYLSLLPVPRTWKIFTLWQLMLWTYSHLNMITTPTETAARILSQQRIRVPVFPVSCGVNTDWFKPVVSLDRAEVLQSFGLNPNRETFLYVGRLDREKRIDLLLKGLAKFLQDSCQPPQHAQIQLAIAGQGAWSGDLRALAQSLGLDSAVRFLGYVPGDRLPDLYRSASVFTMPSPEELQSIATLEAMASGKPILAADARALPELVVPSVNGFLFQPGSVQSVAEGMNWLLANRAAWDQMGRASRSRALSHSLENTIQRYAELYTNLVQVHSQAFQKNEVIKAPLTAK